MGRGAGDVDRFRVFVMLIVIKNFPQYLPVDGIEIMFRNINNGPVTLLGANVRIYLDVPHTVQLFSRADLGLEINISISIPCYYQRSEIIMLTTPALLCSGFLAFHCVSLWNKAVNNIFSPCMCCVPYLCHKVTVYGKISPLNALGALSCVFMEKESWRQEHHDINQSEHSVSLVLDQ